VVGVGSIVPGGCICCCISPCSEGCVFLSGFNVLFSGHGLDVFE
jgi:hypothetical protein